MAEDVSPPSSPKEKWDKIVESITELKLETIENYLENFGNSADDFRRKRLLLADWKRLHEMIPIIDSCPGFDPAIACPDYVLIDLYDFSENFKESIKSSFSLSILYASSLLQKVGSIFSELESQGKIVKPAIVNFEPQPVSSDARKELNRFIRVGQKIRLDLHYSESCIGKMEAILCDFNAQCDALSKFKGLIYDNTFMALAAPSMEGKTQSAFVLEAVRPLYFPLSEAYSAGVNAPQPIYSNFRGLAVALHEAAAADLEIIKKSDEKKKIVRKEDEAPTASELLIDSQKKYWILGFIKYLIKAFEGKSEQPTLWMENYAQPLSFAFIPVSISELKEFLRSRNYCLFLDEFTAKPWAVLIRNLARAVGLRCIIANTNTKIANVIGKDNTSGSAGKAAWSFVVCRLNGASMSILNDELQLFDSFSSIARHRYPDEPFEDKNLFAFIESKSKKDQVMKFLHSLNDEQFEALRPGMAVHVALALKKFCENQLKGSEEVPALEAKFTFGVFLESIMITVRDLMCRRKPRLESESTAWLAKIGLLVEQSYKSFTAADLIGINNAENTFKLCNQRAYLEDHLFYISNPTTAGEWAFVTVADVINEKRVISVASKIESEGRIAQYYLEEWKVELTHFRKEEWITALACFLANSRCTVSNLLFNAKIAIQTDAAQTYEACNELALSNSGNAFEVAAAACIADSSRRSFSGIYTFSGVSGDEFFKNLIRNLVRIDRYHFLTCLKMEFPAELETFLKACSIPFIYGWNRGADSPFEGLNCREEGVFLSNFIRCANEQEIDGRFGMVVEESVKDAAGVVQTVSKEKLVVVECKNYSHNITAPMLKTILRKCRNTGNVGLSLVFGTSFVKESSKKRSNAEKDALEDEAKEEHQKFLDFCHANQINVYRVIPGDTYKIVPFEPAFKITSTPVFNCIVIEQIPINQYEQTKFYSQSSSLAQ